VQQKPMSRIIQLVELPEAIEHVRSSVVQIRVSDTIIGSGFFVTEQAHVITAKHVLDAAGGQAISVGLVGPSIEDERLTVGNIINSLGADVVAVDAINDLALLRLTKNPFAGELPVLIQMPGGADISSPYGVSSPDLERPADGVAIAASGYPLANDLLITSSGTIASGWISDRDAAELLRSEKPRSHDRAIRYLADLEVNGGNSGGPVFRIDSGEVLGVCVATQNALVMFADQQGGPATVERRPLVYSSGLTIVVPARYVDALLDEHGLVWGAGSGDGPS
jgi:S1-C subfamily serine protease